MTDATASKPTTTAKADERETGRRKSNAPLTGNSVASFVAIPVLCRPAKRQRIVTQQPECSEVTGCGKNAAIRNCHNVKAAGRPLSRTPGHLAGFQAPDHFKSQIVDFLAKRVPVEPQELGRADLVSTRSRKANRDQGAFDVLQDSFVQARWWKAAALFGEIARQMGLNRRAQRQRLAIQSGVAGLRRLL